MYHQFPEDNKLNQLRATLTTQAADFVRSVKTAEELEEKGQTGSSLAWYLKAQKTYPPSEFAQEGIERLVKRIMPDSQAPTRFRLVRLRDYQIQFGTRSRTNYASTNGVRKSAALRPRR